ncbi:pantoate--beta-alanine ligase [Mesorhizobium amorphae]
MDARMLCAAELPEMYPYVSLGRLGVSGMSEGLCNTFRPSHFDSVATAVPKLFPQTGAGPGLLRREGFPGAAVVRRLDRDLDIPINTACGCVKWRRIVVSTSDASKPPFWSEKDQTRNNHLRLVPPPGSHPLHNTNLRGQNLL